MARTELFLGLDIGSSTVRAVLAEERGEEGLVLVGVSEVGTEGVRKGAVVVPETVSRSIGRAVREVRKQAGRVTIDHAFVSVGEPRLATHVSRGAVSVSRADGEVTKEDVSRAGDAAEAALPRLSNREVIHSFPLGYTIDRDTNIREPVGLVGSKLEVETLFVTSFSVNLKNLVKAVAGAGLAVDDFVAAPLAASCHALGKKQKEVGSLLLDVGAQTTNLAVFEEGQLILLEILPVGSNHITQDIGLGFQLDLASAERVKRDLGAFLEQGKKEIRLADFPKNFENTFSPKKLKDIVSARLGDIFELTQKHLKRIDRSELLPGGVILVGGGARLFDVLEAAREALRIPAEISQGTPGITIMKKDFIAGPEWATAIGLVRYASLEREPQSRLLELFSSPFSRRLAKLFRALIP